MGFFNGYNDIKRRFDRLTSDELKAEICERSHRRYNTRKVGADGCMIDSWVLRACRELLTERGANPS